MGIERILGDDIGYHVIARCNNKERMLVANGDCRRFLRICEHYRQVHGFSLHAFTIMPSHVHMMVTTHHGHYLDVVMHDICDGFAQYYNRANQRTGHFWISPYRSNVVGGDDYALACLRYVHDNPRRAGLVSDPGTWLWSSHKCYALGKHDEWVKIEPHPSYLALGDSAPQRQVTYRSFFERPDVDYEVEKMIFEGRMKIASLRGKKYISKLWIR